ncbi:MAG: DegV family protein [Clostridia bacterium]
MNSEKIAILVDSCTDVPKAIVAKYGIYTAPLSITYPEKTYDDGIDITADEVFDRFPETPTTSMPSGEALNRTFQQIKKDGYEKVLAVLISSNLSATFQFVKMLGEEQADLEVFCVDTRNIAMGSGLTAVRAAELLAAGMGWQELCEKVSAMIDDSAIFFCIDTLQYLLKGGRIGKVSALFGSTLNLKPVITCDTQEGIYKTVAKAIGRKKSLLKIVDEAAKFVGDTAKYNIALAYSKNEKDVAVIKAMIDARLPNPIHYFEGEIGPTLLVHTGPGIIGIGVQKIK